VGDRASLEPTEVTSEKVNKIKSIKENIQVNSNSVNFSVIKKLQNDLVIVKK
jgi:hypothetical protein